MLKTHYNVLLKRKKKSIIFCIKLEVKDIWIITNILRNHKGHHWLINKIAERQIAIPTDEVIGIKKQFSQLLSLYGSNNE